LNSASKNQPKSNGNSYLG